MKKDKVKKIWLIIKENILAVFVIGTIFLFGGFFAVALDRLIDDEYKINDSNIDRYYVKICLGNHYYWRGLRSDVLSLVVNDNGMPVRCKKLPFEIKESDKENDKNKFNKK